MRESEHVNEDAWSDERTVVVRFGDIPVTVRYSLAKLQARPDADRLALMAECAHDSYARAPRSQPARAALVRADADYLEAIGVGWDVYGEDGAPCPLTADFLCEHLGAFFVRLLLTNIAEDIIRSSSWAALARACERLRTGIRSHVQNRQNRSRAISRRPVAELVEPTSADAAGETIH